MARRCRAFLRRSLPCSACAALSLVLAGCAPQGEPVEGCVVSGVCPASPRGVAKSGFTSNTGWSDGSSCCDICEGVKPVNCFNPPTCGSKIGDDDWDYAVLDQIWLPQLCGAFDQGHDPTLTHAPGARCRADARTRGGLSIHGLWPNYVGGYPTCCRPQTVSPHMLPAPLQILAEQAWVDPTWRDGDGCAFCSMWAHEHMKHGTCMADDMAGYFNVTLSLVARVQERSQKVESLLEAAVDQPISTAAIEEVYLPFSVQVVCDPRDPLATETVGVFLELRTCWNRAPGFSRQRPDVGLLSQTPCAISLPPSCPGLIRVRQSAQASSALAL